MLAVALGASDGQLSAAAGNVLVGTGVPITSFLPPTVAHSEGWLLVNRHPLRCACQKAVHELMGEESMDEINLALHTWRWPSLDSRSVLKENIRVGCFDLREGAGALIQGKYQCWNPMLLATLDCNCL